MKIYIPHTELNLDIVSSIWLCREFVPGAYDAKLRFVRRAWLVEGKIDDFEEIDIAIGIEIQGRGFGLKGKSAFREILDHYGIEEDEVLKKYVEYIEDDDKKFDYDLKQIWNSLYHCAYSGYLREKLLRTDELERSQIEKFGEAAFLRFITLLLGDSIEEEEKNLQLDIEFVIEIALHIISALLRLKRINFLGNEVELGTKFVIH